jgi:hypothetical protein
MNEISKQQDPFEKRLQRERMRQLPADWRASMLSAARAVSHPAAAQDSRRLRDVMFDLRLRVRDLLWPCPQAWGAIAAVWLLLLFLDHSAGAGSAPLIEPSRAALPAMVSGFREQQRLLVELTGTSGVPERPAPKPGPSGPRSDRKNNSFPV